MSINRLAVGAIAFVIGGLSGCGDRGAKRLPATGFKVAFESHKISGADEKRRKGCRGCYGQKCQSCQLAQQA